MEYVRTCHGYFKMLCDCHLVSFGQNCFFSFLPRKAILSTLELWWNGLWQVMPNSISPNLSYSGPNMTTIVIVLNPTGCKMTIPMAKVWPTVSQVRSQNMETKWEKLKTLGEWCWSHAEQRPRSAQCHNGRNGARAATITYKECIRIIIRICVV